MTEIGFAAPAGMVAVGMSNNGPVYTTPGINVKIAGRTVQTFVGEFDERHEESLCDKHASGGEVYGLGVLEFMDHCSPFKVHGSKLANAGLAHLSQSVFHNDGIFLHFNILNFKTRPRNS